MMRYTVTCAFLVASLAIIVFGAPTPVVREEPESDPDTGLRLGHSISPNVPNVPGPIQGTSSSFDVKAPTNEASFYSPEVSHFHSVRIPLPTVRTDVAKSFLQSRFSVKSNEPLQLMLTPAERKSIFEMGQKHLTQRDITWLHAVYDEPQLDLSYRKQLYIASPIVLYDWKKAAGIPPSIATSHWLPMMFYKTDLKPGRSTYFKVAGIEVIQDADEAVKVMRNWDSSDTLQNIGTQFGMDVHPAPV